jgi:hypothetical protein
MQCFRGCIVLLACAFSGLAQAVHVVITPEHVINSFDPDSALGSAIDVLSRSSIDKVYTPHVIQEALSAGWGADYLPK